MTTEPAGGPLSKDEYRILSTLLARFVAHDFDQWDHWRIETPYKPVYVDISARLRDGVTDSAYATIWPIPEQLRSDVSAPDPEAATADKVYTRAPEEGAAWYAALDELAVDPSVEVFDEVVEAARRLMNALMPPDDRVPRPKPHRLMDLVELWDHSANNS